jgi:hypothetical protein
MVVSSTKWMEVTAKEENVRALSSESNESDEGSVWLWS